MGELAQATKTAEPITYAGRLDPLASGVCVLLSGEQRHQKEDYLKLDKEYYLTVVFGIQTDTLDPLGIITQTDKTEKVITEKQVKKALADFSPTYQQTPPRYSSVPIKGQPSFTYAKKDLPDSPPAREVSIKKSELIEVTTITKQELITSSVERVQLVRGDFRQPETIAGWKNTAAKLPEKLFVCKLRVTCTSGTYMRSLARDLGEKLNTPAMALRIMRSRVGDFTLPFQE